MFDDVIDRHITSFPVRRGGNGKS